MGYQFTPNAVARESFAKVFGSSAKAGVNVRLFGMPWVTGTYHPPDSGYVGTQKPDAHIGASSWTITLNMVVSYH